MEAFMPHITLYGLAQENRVVFGLYEEHLERLAGRITKEFMSTYNTQTIAMVEAQSATVDVRSDKKQFTGDEAAARKDLLDDMRRVQSGAKQAFPARSPQCKEFHIGEVLNASTAKILQQAADMSRSFTKYKDVLITKGALLEKDGAALVSSAAILAATDTKQEITRKKLSPDATAAVQAAMDAVIASADFIHTAVKVEFKKEPKILKQFELAKQLRYSTPPNDNPPPPPPADSKN
jgi:hypothetical protein